MKIETPLFTFKIKDNLSAEQRGEIAHQLCRFLIDPPRPQVERRDVAARALMNLYEGRRSRRAKTLETKFRNYLASGWRLERDMETLSEPRSTERVLLHRIGRFNNGQPLCARQFLRIWDGRG